MGCREMGGVIKGINQSELCMWPFSPVSLPGSIGKDRQQLVSKWAISRGYIPAFGALFMLIRAKKRQISFQTVKNERRAGEEGKIRREEKEIKDEDDSPGLWSVTADKVDQKRMHTHTHPHTQSLSQPVL